MTHHDALEHPPSHYIGGAFIGIPGDGVVSHDPAAPDRVIWSGTPSVEHVGDAVAAAREGRASWGNAILSDPAQVLRRWQAITTERAERMAGLITDEMGKVLAESRFEAKALGAKVDVTLDDISLARIREYSVRVNASRDGRCRFKPHGVMAVIGPFNFPAHLANGQIVPALLAGNSVVFKPSEKTPGVGQLMAELWDEIGAPPGVFNVLQGDGTVAATLVDHADVDGILFTGSWPVGRRILEANLDRPGRMVALEMGGNNPAVVLDDCHLRQAVIECARAAFATTGQRCTCTRRIIVQRGIADRFIAAISQVASTLVVGPGRSEPVFMGPIVSEEALESVLAFQSQLHAAGGRVIVEATRMAGDGHFISPGIVEVDGFDLDRDCEVFGPLAQVTIVDDLDAAIREANATRFGLAASIFTRDREVFETFFRRTNAGCINHNTGTAGASSKLPFGGLGHSGNHRPAAAFSVDFCAYPVANMNESGDDVALPAGMTWDERWG